MTKILKKLENKNLVLNTAKISIEDIPNINNLISKKILELLAKDSFYPKEIAKKLKIHEQNIYYYIRKLEKAKIIKIEKQENINGTIANFYTLASDSFYFSLKDFSESSKVIEKESSYLKPFIENGELNSLIVVGSPEPHGPQKARSRDGYYGMDLALFLGTFLNNITTSKVRLDTEITNNELEKNNLIILGGPIVNKVSFQINKNMKIYFDDEKKGIYSNLSKKTYFNDEIGIINKLKSPFNKEKQILFLAGIRNSGTKAVILSFLKQFSKIKEVNLYDNKSYSKVIEGVDLDSDGQIDDIEVLE